MLGDVCEGLGYARPYIHLPLLLILAVAMLFEYVIRPLLRPIKELNTDFTVNRCAGLHGSAVRALPTDAHGAVLQRCCCSGLMSEVICVVAHAGRVEWRA
jgi:hypothetical protein